MTRQLPLIELCIDEADSFVSAISIVSSPAIESSFIAFSNELKNNNYQQFKLESDEKMELLGIAMKANVPIYRNDKEAGEYAVTFSKETIRKIAQTFSKNGFNKNLNIEHSNLNADSYVFQSYIVDINRGMNSPKDIDAKDGDWIVGVKVQDKDLWSAIKAGTVSGFSVEGYFDMIDTNKLIDFQFNRLKQDESLIEFTKQLELELDKIIKTYGL